MNLQTFNFQYTPIRVVLLDDEPWWVAADICAVLDLANSRDAMARLDPDEKGVASTDTPGGVQQLTVINESGLYSLVLGSRKPEARTFKKWITSEVIPSIRRTGNGSAMPGSKPCYTGHPSTWNTALSGLTARLPGSWDRQPALSATTVRSPGLWVPSSRSAGSSRLKPSWQRAPCS